MLVYIMQILKKQTNIIKMNKVVMKQQVKQIRRRKH